ncbi:uncharacterized protein TM35_000351220 [Trypanosoma theileri]|uniref:Uncharacterized protein n=1 Tax=Trypanosoma theileri TaxID=67003 RepID=A0A1X0NLG7_9TRYP|nr:uncharacterized protein TM35_000351220 [Trypanosoma theileri]ORC85378.1 hypothetical protein TM35_000351220 [Trypanosoma theileri]
MPRPNKGGEAQQQVRTEHIVRLEVQRRHAKGLLRVFDTMIGDLDDQLMYVAQFKKEWLQHRKELEAARQQIIAEELTQREKREEAYLQALAELARGKKKSTKVERSTSLSITRED